MTEHEIATGADAFSIVVNHYGNARGTKSEFEKSNPDLLDPLINANLATYHLASDALTPGLASIRAALEECWTGSSADNALSIVDELKTNSSTIGANTLACYDSFVQFQSTWRSCKGDADSLYEGVAGSGAGEDNSGARRVYLRFNNAMQTSMHAMPSELVYSEPLSPAQHDTGTDGTGAGGAGGAGGTGGTGGSGGPGATPRGRDAFVPPTFTAPGAGSTHGATYHGLPGSGTGGVYHGGNGGYGPIPGTGSGAGTGPGLDTTPTLSNYPGGAALPGGLGTGGLGTGGLGAGGLGTGGLGGGLGAGGLGGAANAGMIIPGGFGGGVRGNAALAGTDEAGNAELTGSGSAFDVADEQAGDGVLGAREGIGGVGSDDAAASARPMLGGRGAGGSTDDEDERDRTTWLAEDDGIWESGAAAPPGTIG